MQDYKEIIKNYIKDKKRLKHSISTGLYMQKNAKLFEIDEEKAYIAGLLHDIGKELSKEEIINLALDFEKRNIYEIKHFSFKKRHSFLLHGVASAEIMIRDLGITDTDILIASICHTTGGINLSLLAKYTFLSDFCEPLRDFKEAKIIHKYLVKEKNFNKAYFYTYNYVIRHLLKREVEICVESIDGYNEALRLLM
ncbi:MAG: hypothetical protein A2Y34_11840 [Spirochaetes bacterium GWC1_27_15]|nr:MAG: hypothetical protein A2Z98_13420 [Spirochaetes bacterium GWB1_27_13]OHD20919.1 MAG: hypothetical protein A2Y34_11840 [Spirochaetes bacterium GWC1_27_15]